MIILKPLTRIERLALIEKALIECEEHGYGRIVVDVNEHQITRLNLDKGTQFGNCLEDVYLVY